MTQFSASDCTRPSPAQAHHDHATISALKHRCGQVAHATIWLAKAVRSIVRNHRYMTVAKLGNYSLLLIQKKLRTERVLGLPAKMKIESTNICNTQCQLCPTGQGYVGRDKGTIDLTFYKSLIDRHAWHLMSLDLSMWGDPLIVPGIYDMVRYAHNRRVWTYLSSNLHAFKPDGSRGGRPHAELLVESGLDRLTCSLHGATQATYEAYQPGKRLDLILEKIQRIIETRDRLRSRTPHLQLNFAVTRKNEHEVDAFKRLAASLGCGVVISPAMMNTRMMSCDQKLQPLGMSPELLRKKKMERLDEWLADNPTQQMPAYSQMLQERESTPHADAFTPKTFDCDWPWVQSVINWDGKVSVCCGSFGRSEDMGDAAETTLWKIWNSETYRLARRSFNRGLTASQRSTIICADCPGCML